MAVLAGLFGMIISYFVIQWQSGLIQKELGFVGFGSGFQFIGFWNICMFLLIAAALGAIASYVSVRNINTGWTAREGRS